MPYKKSQEPFPTKEELNNLYWTKELSIRDIAAECTWSERTIHKLMVEYDIPRRSSGEAFQLAVARKPLLRQKLSHAQFKRRRRNGTLNLAPYLQRIRRGISALMELQRKTAKACTYCDNNVSVMHHPEYLAETLDRYISEGLSPLQAVVKIIKEHFDGMIVAIPLCTDCHNHKHYCQD